MRRDKSLFSQFTFGLLLITTLLISSFHTNSVKAAFTSLYFSPSTGSANIGDTVSVTVFVNSSDEAMNSAEGKITFSTDLLEYSSINKKGGILTVWAIGPEINGDIIEFGGGMPSSGYKGPAGRLFTINFKAKANGMAKISFSQGRVLANDGKGTDMHPSLNSAEFNIGRSPVKPTNAPSPTTENVDGTQPTSKPNQSGTGNRPTSTGEVLSATDQTKKDEDKDTGDTSVSAPEITEYVKVITKKEKFFHVKGKTKYPSSEVIITVTPESNTHDRKKYSILTDSVGEFDYTAPSQWTAGKYTFWAEVVNPEGKHSTRSDEISFEIKAYKTEGIIQQVFDFVPIILLLIAFIIMIIQLIRKTLANKRINRHLLEATAEVREEAEKKQAQAAPAANDVQPKPEADPRIKDK